jgi:hypothetical protein
LCSPGAQGFRVAKLCIAVLCWKFFFLRVGKGNYLASS